MYKEYRAAATATASTPDMWAENFAASNRLSLYHRLTFRVDSRWGIIRRHIPPGARILDAGCGAGEWVAFLNERGYDAEGLDYSDELVGRVRAMYPQHRWSQGAVQSLPYADASTSAVISWGVIEHDEAGPERALEEFHRVLTDHGIIVVTVPIDSDRQRRASQANFPESPDQRAFFQHFLTRTELEGYVRRAGFDVVESGLERRPAITLLAPEWTARLSVPLRHVVNHMARVTLWWHPGLWSMVYCVGRKRGPA